MADHKYYKYLWLGVIDSPVRCVNSEQSISWAVTEFIYFLDESEQNDVRSIEAMSTNLTIVVSVTMACSLKQHNIYAAFDYLVQHLVYYGLYKFTISPLPADSCDKETSL